MGYLFDNVNLTAQASSAAAGRLDARNDTQQGGAGPRGLTQNFVIGKDNTLTPTTQIAQSEIPWWAWAGLAVVGLVLVLRWWK
jgi:hypothetical protein